MSLGRIAALFTLAGFAAFCQAPASLKVEGLNGASAALSEADLARLPQQTVKVEERGTTAVLEGVLLSDVLAKVDRPLGEAFHTTAASYYLEVEAADGYRAVFAWAELDPGFMDKPVYLVTKRDGKPLAAKQGPLQLYVPGEKRGARSVRQVIALKIKRAG